MPQQRRRRAPRRAPRRALIRRRRMARSRIMRGPSVHYFKRTAYYSGFINGSTLVDVGGRLIAQLSQVPNFGEFVALFDQYKIMGVKWRFSPRANSAEVGTNQGLVKFMTAIDTDGAPAGAPAPVMTDLLQYESLKVTSSNREHVRYVKPRIASTVFNTALTSGYAPRTAWIDCENNTVPHYGLSYVLQQLPAGNQSYDIQVTYYLAFKNVV